MQNKAAMSKGKSMKRVHRIVRDVPPHWVGDGFPVRSLFSYREGELFDPFLLLDYGGPYKFAPGERRRGVGEHPHRGFETVTLVYQGELEHRDSSGSHGTIGPGDVQWMTAASGVVHEELHSRRFTNTGGVFEVVQLWVNLPAKVKISAPRYQELRQEQIPLVPLPGDAGVARVIAGEYSGTRGPAKTFTPVQVWELQLNAGESTQLRFAPDDTSLLIVREGQATVNDQAMSKVELALFEREGEWVHLHAPVPSRFLVLSGQPLNEPIVGQGPFVMNTREQIHQAVEDYQTGRMGHLS